MPWWTIVAVEVEFLAERLHDELLEVFGEQDERVLVGQDDHVLFALAVARVVPGEGELHGGVGRQRPCLRVSTSIAAAPASRASMSMPCSAAGTRPTVDSTEVRPPTQSSIGKRAMKPCCVGELVELRAGAGDGDGVLAEVEAGGFPGGLGFEHAVAGFRGAAGFGDDEHEGVVEAGGAESWRCTAVHAGGVGVVEEVDRQSRVLADGLGDELRAERGAADADEQDALEVAAVGGGDLAGVDFVGEVLEVGERAGDGACGAPSVGARSALRSQ